MYSSTYGVNGQIHSPVRARVEALVSCGLIPELNVLGLKFSMLKKFDSVTFFGTFCKTLTFYNFLCYFPEFLMNSANFMIF